MIRIEFTEATEVREQGEQVAVDENSAKVFVEELGVAKYLDVDEAEDVEPAPADPAPVVTDADEQRLAAQQDDDTVTIPAAGAYVKPETSSAYLPGE